MTMNNVEDFFGINNWDNNNHHNSNNNNNNGASSLPSLSPSSSSYSNSSTSSTSIVVDPLTDQQEIVISMLGIISGTLSILGSTTIIIKIIRSSSSSRNNTKTPYDRIMLGLSSFDIIASLSWVLTPFLMPSMDSSLNPRIWAVGNAASCTFLGTLTQLGFCAVIYNLVLSFYYLLTVRFGMKRRQFNKKLEPWIHIVPILYFVITAFSGAIVGVYSEVDIGMGCWVNDYPQGCADDEDSPDSCTSPTIGWFFGGFPTVLTFLAIIINNIMIYLYVKKNLKIDNNNNNNNKTIKNNCNNNAIRCDDHDDGGDDGDEDQELEQQHQQEEEEEERLRIDRRRREVLRKRYISDVATQGFLYVCTFLMSYTPAFALRALEVYGSHPISGQKIYPLLAVTATFLPLQGFCNMFVYNRLYYRKLRKAYPNKWMIWSIQKACFASNIQQLLEEAPTSSLTTPIASSSRIGEGIRRIRNHRCDDFQGGAEIIIEGRRRRLSHIHNNAMMMISSSSGKNFSSDLQVVREVSREDDDDDDDDDDLSLSVEELEDGFGSNNNNNNKGNGNDGNKEAENYVLGLDLGLDATEKTSRMTLSDPELEYY